MSTSRPGHGSNRPVLHFAARWLPASEGFVYDLVTHLQRPSMVVASSKVENADRFPFHQVHSLATIQAVVPSVARQKAITAWLLAISSWSKPALVHVHHGYRVDQVLGLARRRSLPVVLSLHGHDLTGLLADQPEAYRSVCDQVQAVVVPSQFLAEHAVRAGFAPEVIHVIPSGIDTSFFEPTQLPGGDPEVLFVGRFIAKKGLDVLAQAWPLVNRQVPSARLRILGFGPLEGLARSISPNAEVVLGPDRTMVKDAMRRARVVVSPSHFASGDQAESLLVVNLEAQASGRPVVTTRHGGIPEYVLNGETALVVPEGDPRSLAEALITVLCDEELAKALGARGPEWVRSLDVRHTARRVDHLYEELL